MALSISAPKGLGFRRHLQRLHKTYLAARTQTHAQRHLSRLQETSDHLLADIGHATTPTGAASQLLYDPHSRHFW